MWKIKNISPTRYSVKTILVNLETPKIVILRLIECHMNYKNGTFSGLESQKQFYVNSERHKYSYFLLCGIFLHLKLPNFTYLDFQHRYNFD